MHGNTTSDIEPGLVALLEEQTITGELASDLHSGDTREAGRGFLVMVVLYLGNNDTTAHFTLLWASAQLQPELAPNKRAGGEQ